MPDLKILVVVVLVAALGFFLFNGGMNSAPAATTTDLQAYWLGRYTFTNTVMLSGLGPQLPPSPQGQNMASMMNMAPQKDTMRGMSMVAGVYAGGNPLLLQTPNPTDMSTMRWDEAQMDKTLTPAAQGYTLLKMSAKQFHLDYHKNRPEKMAAVMMVPEARAIVKLLATMRTEQGLFAPIDSDGKLSGDKTTPQDQVAALWGLSSYVLMATDADKTYWSKAFSMMGGVRQAGPPPALMVDDVDAFELLDAAFQAVMEAVVDNEAATGSEKSLAIEALGWYVQATGNTPLQKTLKVLAHNALVQLADDVSARALEAAPLSDRALAVYALSEAARATGTTSYADTAEQIFAQMDTLWDPQAGVYATSNDGGPIVYDPFTVGAVIAGLNAVRLFGTSSNATLASDRFEPFFENAVVRSGLMQATGYPMMVAKKYRKREPLDHFSDEQLKTPMASGTAAVYASQVTYQNGAWQVTDPRFNTAQAMFLANMSVLLHGAKTDGFIPLHRKQGTMAMPMSMTM